MRYSPVVVVGLLLVGCGPLVAPMTVKLDAKTQQSVDAMWSNMLSPVDRLDRGLLLDVVAAGYLYQVGVDSLHMMAVKHVSGGLRVVMEVDCDRGNPEADQFTIAVTEGSGRTVRRERYSRGEVEASLAADSEADAEERHPSGSESDEQRQRRVEREARRERMLAATQPARVEGRR